MAEKVYEMDDGYKQAAADLVELINARELLANTIKYAAPDKIREGQELIAATDKKIEECEAALAAEYEAHQNKCRAEEKLDEMMEGAVERMAMVFIHIKYRHPEKLEEMRAAVLNNYTAEEEQDFHDRVARLEAGDLIALIARKGETREQTEEFLRNFRAAETKQQ